jgi:hypothetical protein
MEPEELPRTEYVLLASCPAGAPDGQLATHRTAVDAERARAAMQSLCGPHTRSREYKEYRYGGGLTLRVTAGEPRRVLAARDAVLAARPVRAGANSWLCIEKRARRLHPATAAPADAAPYAMAYVHEACASVPGGEGAEIVLRSEAVRPGEVSTSLVVRSRSAQAAAAAAQAMPSCAAP